MRTRRVLRDSGNNSLINSHRERKKRGAREGGQVERGVREDGRKPRFISFRKGSASPERRNFHCS
ncbi:hypothetical protein PUN28_008901 [Cardiocondyla obscurior]|uniref:Uncharacterized protein n=1 Tax=Cardiocondyla obscurior TaxID=286306 RepID=A0AAW2FSV6_9HYME